MAFPPSFLDEIRTRVSLSGLVGRRVQLKQRARNDFWGLSPFTNEKTPSFHVQEDKGFYHCFASGEHGDHFTWLMKTEGLRFPEAVEALAGEAGLQMPERTPEQKQRDQRRGALTELVEEACAAFQRALMRKEGAAALAYLRERGLSDAAIARFRLGYAPADGGALRREIASDATRQEALIEAGVLRKGRDGGAPYAFFRDRIMFPITDRRGGVIGFGGRYMGDAKADGVGKYINSPDTPLFDKGRSLYNLPAARQAAHEGAPLLVVEGYMDVIALADHGLEAAVAPLGTAVTETQITELWRLADEPVLCLDGDAAGRKAALRAADRALPLLAPGKSLRFAFLPAGEDPDTLVRAQGAAAITALTQRAVPLVETIWRNESAQAPLDTPEQKAALEKRLFIQASRIEDETVKRLYQQAFRDRLWRAFRERSNSGFKGGSARGRGAWRGAGNTRFGGRPDGYAKGRLASGEAGAVSNAADAGHRRRQELLLAALINHPGLIADFAEPLAEAPLDPDLTDLRQAIEMGVSTQPDLDAEGLAHHLASTGRDDLMASVTRPAVVALGKQAGRAAPDSEARGLIDAILRQFRQSALLKETAVAAQLQSVVDASPAISDGPETGTGGESPEALHDQARERRIVAYRDSYTQGEAALSKSDDEV